MHFRTTLRSTLSILLTSVLLAGALVSSGSEAASAQTSPPPPAESSPTPDPSPIASATPSDSPSQPGVREEDVSRRSAYSKTYDEPDGTTTVETFVEPIHFQVSDGSWKEIDNTIVADDDGSGFENKAGDLDVDFAASGGSGSLLSVGDGPKAVVLALAGARDVTPAVEDSKITYPEIFPTIDLVYEVRGDGVKELLVLKSRPNVPSKTLDFRFPLSASGLTAKQAGAEVDFINASGETVFSIPKLFMYDSALGGQSAEPAFSESITLTVVDSGGSQSLKVSVDGAWLTAPARDYPVMIDPTIIPGRQPSLDTYVQSNIVNTPQDTMSELKSGTYDSGTTKARSLIKFDLSDVPYGSTINDSVLSLYENHSWSCTGSQVDVYRVTSSWGSNVVWDTKPSFAGSAAASKTVARGYSSSCAADWVDFNVTSVVSYWKNSDANNLGFGVRAESEALSNGWKKFASDNTSNKPKLMVNYTQPNSPPGEPTQQTPSAGATTSKLPTLKATYRDPDDGDWGHVEFEIYHQGTCCGNPHRSGTGSGGNPSDTSTWTPGVELATGSYVWRARGNDGSATSPWTSTIQFNVDATGPPNPTIDSGPADPSKDTTPTWNFHGNESGGTFSCRMTKGGSNVWGPTGCSSSATPSANSGDGVYTFYVSHTDAYGNTSGEAPGSYTLDTTAPAPPSFSSSPPSPGRDRNPSWAFSGETGATFRCRLNDTGNELFETCTSPKQYDLAGKPDKTYYFEVIQIDRATNESLPATRAYRLDTVAAAPAITSAPSDPSSNSNPIWAFSGESGSSFECKLERGVINEFGPEGCTSSKGYNLGARPDDRYTFSVRQTDLAGNVSGWATSSYTLDRTAPAVPRITAAPTSPSNGVTPRWEFDRNGETNTTLRCRLERDGAMFIDWQTCSSPKDYTLTQDGSYRFLVHQQDPSGNTSTNATSTYVLDRVSPSSPVITASPASPSSDRNPSWSFSGEAGARFECRLIEPVVTPAFTPCNPPTMSYSLVGKAEGPYTFEVRQTDAAGNGPSLAARSTYILDSDAPDAPTITARPPEFSNDDTPTWEFTGETGATFACELRRGFEPVFPYFTPCASPKEYNLVTPARQDGTYTFAVSQRDPAGNLSAEATDSYTLDRTGPGAPSAVFSTTHVPKVGFKTDRIAMSWTAPAGDPSGIQGYCWAFREGAAGNSPGPPAPTIYDPDSLFCGTETSARSAPGLGEGSYWFHVRAFDGAGNYGPEATPYGPMIVDPQGSPIPLTPTLDDVLVAQSDTNGMEQFYPYRSFDLGTYTGYVNLFSGNVVAQGTDVSIPGKGLNTVIRHTYNSQRADPSYHDTGMGRGWTLSLSDVDAGLDAAGAILEIDLNAPVVPTSGQVVGAAVGALGGILELTDGDGTVHRLIRSGGPGSRWQSPPGVSLRVRENLVESPTGPKADSYDLIRPDGVVYHVERVPDLVGVTETWHVSSIFDRHGNEMTLGYTEYQDIPALSISRVRVSSITHNRADSNPVVELTYSTTGRLQKIASLPGTPDKREVTYGYTDDRLTDIAENAELATADQRVTKFGYELYERNATDPLDDVKLLARVDDAVVDAGDTHGNRTRLVYDDGSAAGENRLTNVCDRNDFEDASCDQPWQIVYGNPDPNTGERTTQFRTPLSASTSYLLSGRARVSDTDPRITGANILRITDAGSPGAVVSNYRWVENRLVEKTDGAGNKTFMEYNDLGLLTKLDAPPRNRSDAPEGALKDRVATSFIYDPVVSDPSRRYSYDADKCSPPDPDTSPVSKAFYCDAVAEMVRSTSAAGRPDKRVTDFVHAAGTGDLDKVIQRADGSTPLPYDSATRKHEVAPRQDGDRQIAMTYNTFGGVTQIDGPRLQVSDITSFYGYHTTGMPLTITDADNKDKQFTYNPYGMVTSIRDRANRLSTMTYDQRDNLLTSVGPDGDKTTFSYDMNDNRLTATSPKGSASSANGDATATTGYDHNEWPVSSDGPGATEGERITTSVTYNLDGTKRFEDGPPTIGARTTYAYFANQQLRSVTTDAGAGQTATMDYTYDSAGRKDTVKMPLVNGSNRPTRSFSYTPSGAVATVTETSATGTARDTHSTYDAFGATVRVLGPRSRAGNEQEQTQTFDVFGQATVMKRLLDTSSGTKWLTYSNTYDLAGNQTSTTQPTGSGGDSLTATFEYDALNRLTGQSDPQNPGHVTRFSYLPEGQQEFRRDYHDANRDGNLTDAELQRAVKAVFNSDYSVAEMIATDHTKAGSPTVAACNYPAGDLTGGYDRNGNLLVSRTVKGSGGCEGGDVVRTERFTYDARDLVSELTQEVQAPGLAKVTRTQDFTYRADGQLVSSRWDGDKTTSYSYSKGGFLLSATDWRAGASASTFNYFPSGGLSSESLGGGVASATFGYHPDGSVEHLTWNRQGVAAPVRKHSAISYDLGGLRTGEDVVIEPPATNPAGDTGGHASFEHDLAGRLVSWTSPFELSDDVTGTDQPKTTYTLDDGGNITREEVIAGGTLRKDNTATYVNSRLEARTAKTFGLVAGATDVTTTSTFTYGPLGEETRRSSIATATGIPQPQTQSVDSAYDPAGRTRRADNTGDGAPADVDYLYDARGQLIARTANGKTTYLFYFDSGSSLAEEVRPSGKTKTRYFNASSGEVIAEQRFADDAVSGDPDPTNSSWVWLLRDPDGNVATELKETAVGVIVAAQRAYDPYGSPDEGGNSVLTGDKESVLGYQGARTDEDTGNILLGSRIYDPTTDRFTTSDSFVGGSMDVALATDPLTGNRYLFAAANPVAFDDDGHWPFEGCGFLGSSCIGESIYDWQGWDDVANASAGIADTFTLGLTAKTRESMGTAGEVDASSGWYRATSAGTVAVETIFAAGAVKRILTGAIKTGKALTQVLKAVEPESFMARLRLLRRIRLNVKPDSAHHYFPDLGTKMEHFQINVWVKGIKDSRFYVRRFPVRGPTSRAVHNWWRGRLQ
jgi:RHS repeat-associated protein